MSTYHSIHGYSNTEAGAANPLASLRHGTSYKTQNRHHPGSNDPYIQQQQQQETLLRNPSTRFHTDGSIVYDPDYNPKHQKIISMASYDDREDDFEPVEPLFWLLCAVVIGLGVFIAFLIVTGMSMDFPFMRGNPVYIAAGSSAGLLLILFFLYYVVTSQDPKPLTGRFVDGFVGAVPFIILGGFSGYLFSGLVLAMVYLVNDRHETINITWWYVFFSCIPVFLLLYIPMFVVSMQVQEASSLNARIFAGIPVPPAGYVPRTNHIFAYIMRCIRRFVVGVLMTCGLAAYYTIPAFAIGWIAYGLYRAATDVDFWLPIVIMVPAIILIVILCIIAHYKAPTLLSTILMPVTAPLTVGWQRVSLRSSYFPRYYNGETIQHQIDAANRTTRNANKLHVRDGDTVAAQDMYDSARKQRGEIENRGIELNERECKSWRRRRLQKQLVTRKDLKRKGK